MFFTYHQNNSGGYYITDRNVDRNVVIEAPTADEANKRAEDLGLFTLPYCECCGERFWPEASDESGTEVPTRYGEPLTKEDGVVIHLASGLIATLR